MEITKEFLDHLTREIGEKAAHSAIAMHRASEKLKRIKERGDELGVNPFKAFALYLELPEAVIKVLGKQAQAGYDDHVASDEDGATPEEERALAYATGFTTGLLQGVAWEREDKGELPDPEQVVTTGGWR